MILDVQKERQLGSTIFPVDVKALKCTLLERQGNIAKVLLLDKRVVWVSVDSLIETRGSTSRS